MINLAIYFVGFAITWVFAARMIITHGAFNLKDSPADRAFSILLGLIAGWLWPLVVPVLLIGGGVYKVAFSSKDADLADRSETTA